MRIDIDDKEKLFIMEPSFKLQIIKVIKECLKIENISNKIEISFSIVNRETIRKINKDFRGIDKVTDVLSFPLFETQQELKNSKNAQDTIILGDIILCLDVAKEQAIEYNHSLLREICFLVAHSCFHLLGYDHMTEIEEKIMCCKQDYVLNKLNITR
ncbi:rRNA maturation RNase YbeY [Candidatus Epulonipiscioides gigas]|nr:rRNA maturation RNase YbeY [Epulopiscium sp. SCG-C07WGA-EpuloA2]